MTRRGPREIELPILELGADGLGAGNFDGRMVKARNALPGETVTMRVLKRRRGVWYGEADAPAHPAASRREPPCPVFPRCGGCALQHVDYPLQLEHKAAELTAALREHGVVPERVRPPMSGPRLHYRTKARLGVRVVGGELLAGFREGFSNRVARMDDCKTLVLPFARLLPDLKAALGGLSRPDRIPQVELAAGDRDLAVIVRHLDPLEQADRAHLLEFAHRTGARVYLQGGGYDTVTPLGDERASPYLTYTNPDFGLCYDFLPMDFTQVNLDMNRTLVRSALAALAPRPGATATDLFCGIGNFSLALARLGVRVLGYESAEGAVARARHNAVRNALEERAEFAAVDLYDARCPDLPESEYLLLDPPRSGAGENLARWAAWATLRRIAYVSCNPRTFASDAALLEAKGFTLREVGVLDMFPHTAHIETLGLFAREPGAASRG